MGRHVDAAQAYARRVQAGEIPVCKWARLAIDRQLDDLVREPSESWPWVFDADRAERPCDFLELLPHIKGKWARTRQLITLDPWQAFILTSVFGWVHRDTGLRRFREVYLEIPRKNAKSTLSSGVALFMLTADGEQGAEIYSAATTRDQARIVFDDAKAMAERTPDMRTYLGVAILQHCITVAATASKFAPLAAEGSTLDGLNVHFAVLDELHAHKTRAMYDVIDTARGAREQSLLWNITTAGTDRGGKRSRQRHRTGVAERFKRRKILRQIEAERSQLRAEEILNDFEQTGINQLGEFQAAEHVDIVSELCNESPSIDPFLNAPQPQHECFPRFVFRSKQFGFIYG